MLGGLVKSMRKAIIPDLASINGSNLEKKDLVEHYDTSTLRREEFQHKT